jgi:peptidyl-prolyl cis-trans isomerase A (cyclophilin A)
MVNASATLTRRAAAVAVLAASLAWPAHSQAQSVNRVKFQTSQGDFVVELQADKAPKTVENFLRYVADKHYDGTIFHRVIDGFMVQGGGFTPAMVQKPTRAPIPLEASNGLKNDVGTIAMARSGNPNSATSQFFINVANNASLNAPQPDGFGYAVFGKVVSGMDVIDKIRQSPTGNQNGFQNVPSTPISINSVNLIK